MRYRLWLWDERRNNKRLPNRGGDASVSLIRFFSLKKGSCNPGKNHVSRHEFCLDEKVNHDEILTPRGRTFIKKNPATFERKR